jgi:hypothetical protein
MEIPEYVPLHSRDWRVDPVGDRAVDDESSTSNGWPEIIVQEQSSFGVTAGLEYRRFAGAWRESLRSRQRDPVFVQFQSTPTSSGSRDVVGEALKDWPRFWQLFSIGISFSAGILAAAKSRQQAEASILSGWESLRSWLEAPTRPT